MYFIKKLNYLLLIKDFNYIFLFFEVYMSTSKGISSYYVGSIILYRVRG